MSRIVGATLLLIVLVDTFYCSTDVSQAGSRVSSVHVRKCWCKVFPNGKIKCRYHPLPTKIGEKQNLIECICSKGNHHKWRPDCPRLLSIFPMSMV
ncbi:hypothetical protein FQN60_006234 [Etheostoma spectabile]|uniref:CTCK domain-containing protein n=1 Tax=Etheostoma spectabile TaxID=54343 RepID=A0A5J5CP17_9PERO|nr:hypothetical protein FQN60_006234 [Etheostoma spectabile]